MSKSSPGKALIVDDEKANRLVLRTLLKKQGFRTIEARNGQEAIDLLIDKLRTNRVSIHSMARLQVSLEDAFLKIVSDPSEHTSLDSRLDSLRK